MAQWHFAINSYLHSKVTGRIHIVANDSQENSRKDVVDLRSGDMIEYMVKVTDYIGVYPMHCHNVVHEDHAMMLLFEVNSVGDQKIRP